ncbi:MAG: FixH family protein [Spirosomataceae bacterium]
MNWGHKITLFYGSFVVFMITLVTLCVKQKDIFLVSDDYYKKEIAYQDEIIKNRNTNSLSSAVKVEYKAELQQVQLDFPTEVIGSTGKVQFYRPSDAKQDFTLDLAIQKQNSQNIPTQNLKKGLWVVKIEWQKDGKEFLKEEKIAII